MTSIARIALFAFLAVAFQDGAGIRYEFTKGAVKYDFTSSLTTSLKGSDPSFLTEGDSPINNSLSGVVELVTTDITEGKDTATMKRVFKKFKATGDWKKKPFTYEYDAAKDADKAAPTEDQIFEYHYHQFSRSEAPFSVNTEGVVSAPEPWIGAKLAMMIWPLTGELEQKNGKPTGVWITEDMIAVPVFHDKIHLRCINEKNGTVNKNGKSLLQIKTKITFKDKTVEMDKRMPDVGGVENDYEVNGEASIEIDTAKKRLHSITLSISLKLEGKVATEDGGERKTKGTATYKESMTCKD